MKKLIILAAISITMSSVSVFAQATAADKNQAAAESVPETKEKREKMAVLHEKMAQCLRSEKPMKECHQEMHAQCEGDHAESCPMMGKGMMKHHKKMMKKKEKHSEHP